MRLWGFVNRDTAGGTAHRRNDVSRPYEAPGRVRSIRVTGLSRGYGVIMNASSSTCCDPAPDAGQDAGVSPGAEAESVAAHATDLAGQEARVA